MCICFWRRLLGAVQLRQVRVRMQGERAPFWSVHDEQRDAKLPLLSGLLDIPCVSCGPAAARLRLLHWAGAHGVMAPTDSAHCVCAQGCRGRIAGQGTAAG
jgi:hypothetical protein